MIFGLSIVPTRSEDTIVFNKKAMYPFFKWKLRVNQLSNNYDNNKNNSLIHVSDIVTKRTCVVFCVSQDKR